jgi:hypothetical protein
MCDYLDTTAIGIAGIVNLPGEYGYLHQPQNNY